MTLFTLGLAWDSMALAEKINQEFVKRGLKNKNKKTLYDHAITMGFSDNMKESAFIIEGFDWENKFGLVVTITNKKKEITIMGGKFDNAKIPAKYNKTFTDLGKASKYFERAITELDKLVVYRSTRV